MLANTSAFREDAGMDCRSRRAARRPRRGRACRFVRSCLEHLADEGFSVEELAKGGGLRTGWRCSGGSSAWWHVHGQRRSRSTPAAGRADDSHSPGCNGLPQPDPDDECSVTRTSRRPARPSCSSRRASTRIGSSRSLACSARAWARLAATITAAFVETFLEAGDSEEDCGAPLRPTWPSS